MQTTPSPLSRGADLTRIGACDGRVTVRQVRVMPNRDQRRARQIGLAVLLIMLAAVLTFTTRTQRDSRLIEAAQKGDVAGVRALLAQGANLTARGADGQTALEAAAGRGHGNVVRALLQTGRVSAQDGLLRAALKGQADIVKLLLASGARVAGTDAGPLLCAAAQSGDIRTVNVVLAAGGSTALNWRAANRSEEGMTPVMFAVRSGRSGVVYTLAKRGADIRARSKGGRTLLMHAAVWNTPEICSFLIKNGVRVNDRDEGGRTALMIAAEAGNRTNVDYLLKAGASVHTKDAQNKTALDYALQSGDMRTQNLLRRAAAAK